MATFGLVHGVCAGAWSWELLTPHLKGAGHEVIAVDLPCEDPNATFSDYASVVEDALSDSGDDVVLIGHSTGGMTIPLVAARRPVRELVFVCGLIPVPGKSVVDEDFGFRATDPGEWQFDNGDGSFSVRPGAIRAYIAQDLDPPLVSDPDPRLRRQYLTPFGESCPLQSMPRARYRYVLCEEDLIVSPTGRGRRHPSASG